MLRITGSARRSLQPNVIKLRKSQAGASQVGATTQGRPYEPAMHKTIPCKV
jgi:hypothetical protein